MAEKYYGKEKCKVLKEIRKKIAEENGIEYNPIECTHEGDCAGTCPACEAELMYIHQQIEDKKKNGKQISISGICNGAIDEIKAYVDSLHKICNPSGSIVEHSDSLKKGLINSADGDIDIGCSDDFDEDDCNNDIPELGGLVKVKDDEMLMGWVEEAYEPVSFTISEAKDEQEDDSESDNES